MKSIHQRTEGLLRSARTRWVVVGDSSRFIIYETGKGKPLSKIKTFTNQAARQKVSELTTGQPGRSFDRFSRSSGGHQTGTPRHAYGREDDPKTHAIHNFVREVAGFLNQANGEHDFDNMVLIMSDRLLGKLRLLLDKPTQAMVSEEHIKDLAWISSTKLETRVESLLALN